MTARGNGRSQRGEYRIVQSRTEDSATFQSLTMDAQRVYYALVHRLRMSGIHVCYVAELLPRCGRDATIERTEAALRDLELAGMLERVGNVWWLHGRLSEDHGMSPASAQHRAGLYRHIASLPNDGGRLDDMLARFAAAYPEWYTPAGGDASADRQAARQERAGQQTLIPRDVGLNGRVGDTGQRVTTQDEAPYREIRTVKGSAALVADKEVSGETALNGANAMKSNALTPLPPAVCGGSTEALSFSSSHSSVSTRAIGHSNVDTQSRGRAREDALTPADSPEPPPRARVPVTALLRGSELVRGWVEAKPDVRRRLFGRAMAYVLEQNPTLVGRDLRAYAGTMESALGGMMGPTTGDAVEFALQDFVATRPVCRSPHALRRYLQRAGRDHWKDNRTDVGGTASTSGAPVRGRRGSATGATRADGGTTDQPLRSV